ncbi:MAG: hypothetical protein ACLUN5_00635 [Oscillospiraceae bacterium]
MIENTHELTGVAFGMQPDVAAGHGSACVRSCLTASIRIPVAKGEESKAKDMHAQAV